MYRKSDTKLQGEYGIEGAEMTDRERVYNLVNKVCDYSIELMNKVEKLKQESNELKQRVAELEKPKKKHKFRAITIEEHCAKEKCGKCEYHDGWFYCDYSDYNKVNRGQDKKKPYKTKDGKYILVEKKNEN